MSTNTPTAEATAPAAPLREVTCKAGTIRIDDSVKFKLPTGAMKLMRVAAFGRQRSTGKDVFFGYKQPGGNIPWGYIEDVIRVVPRSQDSEADWGEAIHNPIPKITW